MHDYHENILRKSSRPESPTAKTIQRYQKVLAGLSRDTRVHDASNGVSRDESGCDQRGTPSCVYGRVNMSPVEKIVFVSDLAEPSCRSSWDTKALFDLACEDLDLACEKAMKIIMDYAITDEKN